MQKSNWKVVKTKPSNQAKIGDTIILIKDRNGHHHDNPKAGTICKIIGTTMGIFITDIPSPIGDPT